MNRVHVIKIGGKVIDDEDKLDAFLKSFIKIKEHKILIHGGGAIATKIGTRMGLETKMVNGRRVTDSATLDLITMVYGGLINKKIVAKLQALGTKSVGFSGADLNLMHSIKRSPKPVDFGWVGDIDSVDVDWLLEFFRHDVVPVMAPLTHDGKGHILNTNADAIASHVASALAEFMPVDLTLCFEQSGVMKASHVISSITEKEYEILKKDRIVTDGMIPKLDLGFHALHQGVESVAITNFNSILNRQTGTALLL